MVVVSCGMGSVEVGEKRKPEPEWDGTEFGVREVVEAVEGMCGRYTQS